MPEILIYKSMTVVSTKEFTSNQELYFNLALSEDVFIKRRNGMFHLIFKPAELKHPEQPVLAPDDNLRMAITAEELLERIHKDIHIKYASRI